jgi:hypothetical protein
MFENSADDNDKSSAKDGGKNDNSNTEEKSFKVVDKRLFSKDGMTGDGGEQKTKHKESVAPDESAKGSDISAESASNSGVREEKNTKSAGIKTELHDNTQSFSHANTFEENKIIGGSENASLNAGGNADADKNVNNIDELQADFSTFVYSLNAQALLYLGKLPNPMTGKYEKDLKTARYLIDTLDMLSNKTKGNLDDNESKLMTNILYDLKMFYVNEK